MSVIHSAILVCYSASFGLILFLGFASQIQERLVIYNVGRIAAPFVLCLCLLVLYETGELSVLTALTAQTASAFAVAACLFILVVTKCYPFDGGAPSSKEVNLHEITKLGMKYHAVIVMGLVVGQVDKLYFIAKGSASEFGIYAVAFGTSRIIGAVQESISTAIFSRFTGTKVDAGFAALLAFRLSFFPMLIIGLFLGASSPWLMPLVFGREFESAALPFTILLIE